MIIHGFVFLDWLYGSEREDNSPREESLNAKRLHVCAMARMIDSSYFEE